MPWGSLPSGSPASRLREASAFWGAGGGNSLLFFFTCYKPPLGSSSLAFLFFCRLLPPCSGLPHFLCKDLMQALQLRCGTTDCTGSPHVTTPLLPGPVIRELDLVGVNGYGGQQGWLRSVDGGGQTAERLHGS